MTGESFTEVAETIRQFVLARCLPGASPDQLPDDCPLQSSGILDSLATLGLIAFLEERFGVELDVYETSADCFDRIADMAATIVRKRSIARAPVAGTAS